MPLMTEMSWSPRDCDLDLVEMFSGSELAVCEIAACGISGDAVWCRPTCQNGMADL